MSRLSEEESLIIPVLLVLQPGFTEGKQLAPSHKVRRGSKSTQIGAADPVTLASGVILSITLPLAQLLRLARYGDNCCTEQQNRGPHCTYPGVNCKPVSLETAPRVRGPGCPRQGPQQGPKEGNAEKRQPGRSPLPATSVSPTWEMGFMSPPSQKRTDPGGGQTDSGPQK